VSPEICADREPTLVLEEYFVQALRAHGIFRYRNGRVGRSFVVDIQGSWDEQAQTLTLREDFTYGDGETETRIWHLHKTGPDDWTGTTDGVVGQARGQTSGNAFNWAYTFTLARPGGRSVRLDFNDWMYLQPDGVLINHATLRKFGFRVGELIISFAPVDRRPVPIGESAADDTPQPQGIAAE